MGRTLAAVLGIALVLALALATDRLRAHAHEAYVGAQRYEDIYYLPPPAWLPVFSLGYDEALADALWMRALVYFGDEFLHEGAVRHVFDYGEAIATLDPDFRALYRWIGTAGMYRPQAITAEDIERTVAFMQRGAQRFPNDGELLWEIGAALAYELPPMIEENDPAAGDRARARAAPYLMAAVRLGAGPDWAALANAALLDRVGRAEQAASHLEDMYAQVHDPQTRARIAQRIEALRSRARAEAFVERMSALEAKRRAELPYLDATQYLLIGPRPPVDEEQAFRDGFVAGGGLGEP
ncbi:MAG: hypothetical protein ACFCGT_10135 [Sandaracinaceae bacterium]